MAGQISCDLCHEEPATLLVGELATGRQTGIGANCVYLWAVTLVDAVATPDQRLAAIGQLMPDLTPPEEVDRPRGRRPKKAQERAQRPHEQAAQGVEEAPAAPADG